MKKNTAWIIFWFFVIAMLAACGSNGDATSQPPTETAAVLPTNTPVPTEPEPAALGVVVLVAPPEGDAAKIQELEQQVGAAVMGRGLVLEKRAEINPQTAPENLVMVAAAADFVGLAEMADAMPDVKFVVAGASAATPKPNLTAIGGGDDDLSLIQAFMAGYIAAVQSEEYRVGIISVNDATGQEYRDAFLNGAIYFCGNCATLYPPFEVYPAYESVAPGADQTALENAARALIAKGVNMILVAPSLQNAGFYQILAQNGVRLIGTDAPPAGLESSWVASVLITSGVSLEAAIGAVLDGNGVPQSEAQVVIDYTGVGEARLAHFAQILAELNSGAIDPLGGVD